MIIGVRHAPVEASMVGRCYGALDVATASAQGDAARLAMTSLDGMAVEHRVFDSLWTSDLSRCRGLADALAPMLSQMLSHTPDVCVDARLRELSHGSFEGREWDEIHRNDAGALARWGTSWQTEGPPGGESAAELEQRVSEWSASLDPHGKHLLIGHAGVMRALLVIHKGLDWASAMGTPVAHLEAVRLS